MKNPAKILSLVDVPSSNVRALEKHSTNNLNIPLSPQEEQLVKLISAIIVEKTLNKQNEKGNTLSAI